MMKKVSFKSLRLSFTRKPRDKTREKSPVNDGNKETNSDTSNIGDPTLSSQDSTCQTRQSRGDPANPGEILIPTRKEKKGLFGTLGKKLRNSFYRKQLDTTIVVDENIGTPSPTADTATRRKKRKPKHVNPRGIIRPIDKPLSSTTSDEASDGVSGLSVQLPHRTRHSKTSYSGLEKRETHSSCSSDSCEHDNCITRCSKVSVNVHICDNKEHSSTSHSGGSLNSASATASGTNKPVDQQSLKNVSPQPGIRNVRHVVPNPHSHYSDPGILEISSENKLPPAIPPRPDVLPVPGRSSLSMVIAHRGLSFGLGGALSMVGAFGGDEYDYHNPLYDEVRDAPKMWSLTKELLKLSRYGWYWGPLTRIEAEDKLAMQPNGAFLVRDSSDDRYLLSLSFRSNERTLHTRIEHCNGMFSFYAQPELEGYPSIVDLIEHSMNDSLAGVFCYSRARTPGEPSFPVRLTKPVSRFTQVRSLQYLCRFVIRQYTRLDHIQKLPLPPRLKGWLEQNQY